MVDGPVVIEGGGDREFGAEKDEGKKCWPLPMSHSFSAWISTCLEKFFGFMLESGKGANSIGTVHMLSESLLFLVKKLLYNRKFTETFGSYVIINTIFFSNNLDLV